MNENEIDSLRTYFTYIEFNISKPKKTINEILEETTIKPWTYKILTNMFGEITSIILLFRIEDFKESVKAKVLKGQTLSNLLKYFVNISNGELENSNYEEISQRNKNAIYDHFLIKESFIYEANNIFIQDIFDILKENQIKNNSITINIEENNANVFTETRKILNQIKRREKREISYSEIENIIYAILRKTKQHKNSSEIKNMVNSLYSFYKNDWFKTEKERQHYWYMKRKDNKITTKEDINKRISKTVKTKRRKAILNIIITLKKLNMKDISIKSIYRLRKLFKVSYNTLKKYLKELNLVKKVSNKFIILIKFILVLKEIPKRIDTNYNNLKNIKYSFLLSFNE